jgi:ABC-type Zn uptake system ZnuABC Zn-binding protein ZnuA
MLDTLDTQEQQIAEHKVRTVFLLGAAEREALDKISAETGAPVAELLRRAADRYLNDFSSGSKAQATAWSVNTRTSL